MLPLAHIYVSTKAAKRSSLLLVFGSVLPDISWSSKSEIGRDQIHYSPQELYNFTKAGYPNFLDVALGVKLHSNVDKGADYYCDNSKVGFAYIEGRKIEDRVARLFDQEKNETTLVFAHSFIEVAVDWLLRENKSQILQLYENAISYINLEKIAAFLAEYLSLEKTIVLQEINKFLYFVGPKAYMSKREMEKRIVSLAEQRRGIVLDHKDTISLVDDCIQMMKDKYMGYLNNIVKHLRNNFDKELVG